MPQVGLSYDPSANTHALPMACLGPRNCNFEGPFAPVSLGHLVSPLWKLRYIYIYRERERSERERESSGVFYIISV